MITHLWLGRVLKIFPGNLYHIYIYHINNHVYYLKVEIPFSNMYVNFVAKLKWKIKKLK